MPHGPQLPDTLAFRAPADLGQRIRAEAAATDRKLGDVVREYVVAGMSARDVERKTAPAEPASAVTA